MARTKSAATTKSRAKATTAPKSFKVVSNISPGGFAKRSWAKFSGQNRLFITGIVVPTFLVLLGHWFVTAGSYISRSFFSILDLAEGQSIFSGVPEVTAFTEEGLRTIGNLGSFQGIFSIVVGAILVLLGIVRMRAVFKHRSLQGLTLGQIRLQSVIYALLAAFVLMFLVNVLVSALGVDTLLEVSDSITTYLQSQQQAV
jgi:hypothetical protein